MDFRITECNEMSPQFTLWLIIEFGEVFIMAARSVEVGHRMRKCILQIMGTVTQKQGVALVQRVCK